MTQPEVSMTPEEVMSLLGSFSGDADYNFNFQIKCEAARAAVAELVKERDEFRKDRDEWKEYCARVSEGKEAAENERAALRRRVEELERARSQFESTLIEIRDEYAPNKEAGLQAAETLKKWGTT